MNDFLGSTIHYEGSSKGHCVIPLMKRMWQGSGSRYRVSTLTGQSPVISVALKSGKSDLPGELVGSHTQGPPPPCTKFTFFQILSCLP